MNKSQLTDAIAARTGIAKQEAKRYLEAFVAVTIETLKSGEKISINGFGSFVVTRKPARTGRNFKTGAAMDIPARTVVKFRPAMTEVPEMAEA